MAQAVSRRPLTAEARVRSRVSPCGICGGQSGNGTGFSPSTSVFPFQFHSNGAPLQGKTKKLVIFIMGLHNEHQGCGASLASALGPFRKKKPSRRAKIWYESTTHTESKYWWADGAFSRYAATDTHNALPFQCSSTWSHHSETELAKQDMQIISSCKDLLQTDLCLD
jgi:hypothetical protein